MLFSITRVVVRMADSLKMYIFSLICLSGLIALVNVKMMANQIKEGGT